MDRSKQAPADLLGDLVAAALRLERAGADLDAARRAYDAFRPPLGQLVPRGSGLTVMIDNDPAPPVVVTVQHYGHGEVDYSVARTTPAHHLHWPAPAPADAGTPAVAVVDLTAGEPDGYHDDGRPIPSDDDPADAEVACLVADLRRREDFRAQALAALAGDRDAATMARVAEFGIPANVMVGAPVPAEAAIADDDDPTDAEVINLVAEMRGRSGHAPAPCGESHWHPCNCVDCRLYRQYQQRFTPIPAPDPDRDHLDAVDAELAEARLIAAIEPHPSHLDGSDLLGDDLHTYRRSIGGGAA